MAGGYFALFTWSTELGLVSPASRGLVEKRKREQGKEKRKKKKEKEGNASRLGLPRITNHISKKREA